MSTPNHSWDADIRRKVEQHVFDYDPQAWTDMEQLLDEAGGGSSASTKGKAGRWGRGGLILLAILGLTAVLMYGLRQPPAKPALGAFTLAPRVEPEMGKASPAPTRPMEQAVSLRETPATVEVPPPAEVLPVEMDTVAGGREPARPPVRLMQPLDHEQGIPLLRERTLPTTLTLQPLPAARRRRDRSKLFPDVIPAFQTERDTIIGDTTKRALQPQKQ
ncbi:MAG: hypothetical protein KDC54_01365 [Lewinella sp.]|nr:hypothetical protein [Lewinella sp.]